MKAKLLKQMVALLNDEDEIVVQRNFAGGGFNFVDFKLWPGGHIGYDGPIIMLGETVEVSQDESHEDKSGG